MYLNHMILDGLTSFAALTALTVGVVQVIKKAAGLEKRWVPLTALLCGIILTFVGGWANITSISVLTGLAVGLSAAGLWDQKAISG